jgi:TRAP-type mannitol/chloroaromatic compound transport system permease large subunit
MLLVLGGIYSGAVTPNEAAGLGVFGALAIAAADAPARHARAARVRRRTLRLTAGIIVIFMFAAAFSRFHRAQRADPATRRFRRRASISENTRSSRRSSFSTS